MTPKYTSALNKIQEVINSVENDNYNTTDEDTQNYINLANDLNDLITIRTQEQETETEEAKEDEIRTEVYNMFKDIINIDESVSDEVANALAMACTEVGIEEATGNNDREDVLQFGGNEGDSWCVYFGNWLYGKARI